MHLTVRVTPRASADSVSAPDANGVVHIRVTAAPTDGQANEAVTRLLAKALSIPPRDVVLVSGATSRTKVFDLPFDAAAVAARLASPRR